MSSPSSDPLKSEWGGGLRSIPKYTRLEKYRPAYANIAKPPRINLEEIRPAQPWPPRWEALKEGDDNVQIRYMREVHHCREYAIRIWKSESVDVKERDGYLELIDIGGWNVYLFWVWKD